MAEQSLIDISPEQWEIVRDILQRYVPDREVWAFGSRAKWTAKEFSDLGPLVENYLAYNKVLKQIDDARHMMEQESDRGG